MNTSRITSNRRAGFTLLEVMVALGVLAMAVVPILLILGNNRRTIEKSILDRRINMLARQKLTDILTQPGEPRNWGGFRGIERDDVRWEMVSEEEKIEPTGEGLDKPIGTLEKVTLTIIYRFRDKHEKLVLVTYRPLDLNPEETGVQDQ